MQGQLPAPTASGSLTKTPFPHLLVYALERRLTGSFELSDGTSSLATMLVVEGCPAKVRTADAVHRLGDVLVALGTISPEQLAASRAQMEVEASPRLHGQILVQMGALDAQALEAGLRAQVERKVGHLFGLPSHATFTYYDGHDLTQGFGGPPTPTDPLPVLWRGVWQAPSWEHIDATLKRISGAAIRISAAAKLERFAFGPEELRAIDRLRERPLTINDFGNLVGPSLAQVLVYVLVIMKQVELEAAPSPASSPRMPAEKLARPPTGQAFARVALARQAARPLVVEEQSSPTRPHDGRASRPSIEPGTPEAGKPDSNLTVEQNALKAKIVERAAQISSQDYFAMLGLQRDATPEAVQKTFIALAKVWHPDRLPAALADVKDACAKVFAHLTEAHSVLTDATKRQDYMTLLKEGGATPDDQAKIQAVLEAATEFQKAEFLLKRSLTDPQAYELIKRCVVLDPEQPDYMAMLAWLDAQKPASQGKDKTLEKVQVLDRCIEKNPKSERAFFYRALLYKRIDMPSKAIKDFKKAAELNPRNLDALREVRLHNMRHGPSSNSTPPPGDGEHPSKPPAAPAEKLGGLFGKLFKK